MRYNLESTLPIRAFSPLGGRHNPFKQGMTLEGGGGGGGIISSITDPISSALGTDGGGGGLLGGLADVDKAVGDTIPGGWGTIAAIAMPYLAPELIALEAGAAAVPLTAGQAAAVAAGTSAATGAIKGKSLDEIALNAALAGGTSYGLNTLFGGAGYVPDEGSPYINGIPPDMDLNARYIDAPDGENLLNEPTPDVPTPENPITPKGTLSPEEQFAKNNYIPPELRAPNYVEPTYIPPELNLGNLYQDFPDGLSQLGYSQDQLASIASPSTPTSALEEEAKEKFFKELINNPNNPITPSSPSPRPNFLDDPVKNISNRTSDAIDYLKNTPIKEMGSDLYDFAGRNKLELGIGALALSNMGGQQPQPQGQPAPMDSRYTGGYGSAGPTQGQYGLKNVVNRANVYDYLKSRGYKEGGEVKHFGYGGISNALTRVFQPVEKAIIQPIGQAAPFLKDIAPYAGLLAAPFIASPVAAAGIGALSSGFGRPGTGFDMKRALMGGIAAYGASNVGAGLEAAGGKTSPIDLYGESYAVTDPGTVPGTSTSIPLEKSISQPFFRDTDAMQRGVGNLLKGGESYDTAAKAFGTQAGLGSAGSIVMGTSGMMGVDEANKMRAEADRAAAVGKQENIDMLARISKGKKRAEQAVRENPYMYAMGGSVDDESGMDEARGLYQGNMQNGFIGGGIPMYAEGGIPRFLSGDGDGMSDSIRANIEGTQEARLADGEFVIPADVVSHLGNGSSKAGAKQLYSMMDRVRQARTGNEKQGRQIKPKKLMPA